MRQTGFTLLEIAVIIGVVALLSGIALIRFGSLPEDNEATMANSVQSSLQTSLAQMSVRLEERPNVVFNQFQNRLIQFASIGLQPDQERLSSIGNRIQLSFLKSNRSVSYGLSPQGDIVVMAENFNNYQITSSGHLGLP